MANEADELGRRLAARLRSAADRDPQAQPTLDAQAQARVLAAMVSESARLERARRRRRAVMGAALALAACVLLGLSLHRLPTRAPQTVARPAEDGVCSLPTDLASLHFLAAGDRLRMALGRFGELAATGDAQLRIVSATPCTLTIALARGTLAGDLHALRPATLRVQTALGDVEVRGTRFSVRLSEGDGSLEVALLRGAVDVVTDRERSRLAPGQVLRRKAHGPPKVDRVSEPAARTIAALIDELDAAAAEPVQRPAQETVAPAAASHVDGSSLLAGDASDSLSAAKPAEEARSSTELLAAAERERRAGRLSAARALYREAGTRKGADAEVALLRWARLELSTEEPTAARDVLARYRQRFADGRLRAEASWLELRALQDLGREPAAREAARQLIEEFPDSPHAKAAQRLLSEP